MFSLKINFFEPVIGNWKLLYSDNKYFNKYGSDNNNFDLEIFPFNDIELSVKIKRYENYNFITYIKSLNCKAYQTDCNNINDCIISDKISINDDICTLIILTAEKNIKSIGIFEFPYFSTNYISSLRPEYYIIYKIDIQLNRLYILFDNNIYVFQRSKISKVIQDERVITNVFLVTNFISFLVGKFLEKIIHIN
jgi:hypothetical protein